MRVAATRRRRDRQLAPRPVDELVDAKRNGREDDEEDNDDDGDDVVALRHGGQLCVLYACFWCVSWSLGAGYGEEEGGGVSVRETEARSLCWSVLVVLFVVMYSVPFRSD